MLAPCQALVGALCEFNSLNPQSDSPVANIVFSPFMVRELWPREVTSRSCWVVEPGSQLWRSEPDTVLMSPEQVAPERSCLLVS